MVGMIQKIWGRSSSNFDSESETRLIFDLVTWYNGGRLLYEN